MLRRSRARSEPPLWPVPHVVGLVWTGLLGWFAGLYDDFEGLLLEDAMDFF